MQRLAHKYTAAPLENGLKCSQVEGENAKLPNKCTIIRSKFKSRLAANEGILCARKTQWLGPSGNSHSIVDTKSAAWGCKDVDG